MSHGETTTFLLAIALLIGSARILGEIAQRFRQPAVLGELVAGILLGPTVLGYVSPALQGAIFPATGAVPVAIAAMATLSITLFLAVAGLEVDLSKLGQQGKAALAVGAVGIVVPFAIGFVPAYLAPGYLGAFPDSARMVFALFFATAMSITALPVIAKILMDLHLFRTDVGIVVVAAAIINDLAGWIIFAFVLALMSESGANGYDVAVTAGATLLFAGLMLTVGRSLMHRLLPWVQAHSTWPGGVLGFVLSVSLLCAAFTEWIGVHAVFGAFLFGVAVGDSPHLRQRTRATIEQFVAFIFAPLFFASIGLRVDFVNNFNLPLVLLVLFLASLGKIVPCMLAARTMGFSWPESKAIGYGMNARGAMEIILGLLALQAGIIGEELFVALVVMALATSITTGALMQRVFGQRRALNFVNFVTAKTFIPRLAAQDRRAVLRELGAAAAEAAGLPVEATVQALVDRDDLVPSGLGQGVAVPHVRFEQLKHPTIAVGISVDGIDFDAADGEPAHVIIVILAPTDDPSIQLDVLASIARLFLHGEASGSSVCNVVNFTEFRAFVRAESSAGLGHG